MCVRVLPLPLAVDSSEYPFVYSWRFQVRVLKPGSVADDRACERARRLQRAASRVEVVRRLQGGPGDWNIIVRDRRTNRGGPPSRAQPRNQAVPWEVSHHGHHGRPGFRLR